MKSNTTNKTTPTDDIIPIRLNKELKQQFKAFCDKNGYALNKRIKVLIMQDMEKNN